MLVHTLIILSLVIIIVGLVEQYKNRRVLIELTRDLHSSYLTVFLLKNRDLLDTHPHFFNVVNSFNKANLNDYATLKKSLRKIDKRDSQQLKSEMIDIAENGSDEQKALLGWYIFTCKNIDLEMSRHSILSHILSVELDKNIVLPPSAVSRSDVSAATEVCVA